MTIRLNDFGAFCLSFLISGVMTLLGFKAITCIIAAFLLTMTVYVGLAYAQTTCTTVGNTTYCTTPTGPVNCTVVGNTMYCN